jgi:hypothetical protein
MKAEAAAAAERICNDLRLIYRSDLVCAPITFLLKFHASLRFELEGSRAMKEAAEAAAAARDAAAAEKDDQAQTIISGLKQQLEVWRDVCLTRASRVT